MNAGAREPKHADFVLLESIRVEKGKPFRVDYHQQRINDSILQLTGRSSTLDLNHELVQYPFPKDGIYKCRIIYTPQQIVRIACTPYRFIGIRRIYAVSADSIDYSHKFADRSALESLAITEPHSDVLLIRQGKVTDTLYANTVFWDGSKWLTPAVPLLRGTMRKALLDAGEIQEDDICLRQLRLFKYIRRINALMEFDDPPLPVSHIIR